MHEFAVFNYQIVPAESLLLNAVSPASFYGKGIFTTVAIYNSQPFLWEKHWRRITENARKVRIDLTNFSQGKLKESLLEIIAENKITDGRARLTFFDESSIPIWQAAQKKRTGLLINTAEFRPTLENLNLTVSTFYINSASPLAGVKSCNYLENVLALEDAREKGFDEAIRVNERGKIVSACMANVFWQKESEIFTANLETGCLPGTTREFILENYSVKQTKADLAELQTADAIFLTSAGIGIVQAAEFQGKNLNREVHELTKIIRR